MKAAIFLVAALLVPLACASEESESEVDQPAQQLVDECVGWCRDMGDCTPSPQCLFHCQATEVNHCRASALCADEGYCCLYQDYTGCGYCSVCD